MAHTLTQQIDEQYKALVQGPLEQMIRCTSPEEYRAWRATRPNQAKAPDWVPQDPDAVNDAWIAGDGDPRLVPALVTWAARQDIEVTAGLCPRLADMMPEAEAKAHGYAFDDHRPLGLCQFDVLTSRSQITVDERLRGGALFYIMAHEITHALYPMETRAMAEIMADTVAAIVCRHFGIDADDTALYHVFHFMGVLRRDMPEVTQLIAPRSMVAEIAGGIIEGVESCL